MDAHRCIRIFQRANGGVTLNVPAHKASEDMIVGYNSTLFGNCFSRRAKAASPGKRTGGFPAGTGAVRHASAKKLVSRQNASRPPKQSGLIICRNTDAPHRFTPLTLP